jgi:TIGR03009 family protein
MRRYGLVLTGLLLAGAYAGAQTPPAGSATPPGTTPPAGAAAASSAALEKHLLRWEQEMKKVQTLAATLNLVEKDSTFNAVTKSSGVAWYMKAGTGPTALNLGLLELKLPGKTDIHKKFVCSGTYVYEWVPAQKIIRAHEIPKPKPGQVADDSFLSFLFGMKAEEAKKRYALSLYKEDKFYVYIDIVPRRPEDKADFKRARLVLNRDNFLPRQLWFEQPNGSEVTWDIPTIRTGMSLDRRYFDAPKAPDGWKVVPVPKAAGAPSSMPPPTVVRPSK